MEFTGLVMFHPHLKEAELIEQQGSLLKIQLQCQLGGKTWQSWGKVLQEAVYGLNRHPICGGFFSPTAQNQEVGRQHHHSPLLLITHQQNFCPIPVILFSVSLEVSFLKWGMLLPGKTKIIPLNWNLTQLSGRLGLLMPLNQWVKKGVIVLAGWLVQISCYQGKIGLLLHSGSRKNMSRIQRIAQDT